MHTLSGFLLNREALSKCRRFTTEGIKNDNKRRKIINIECKREALMNSVLLSCDESNP